MGKRQKTREENLKIIEYLKSGKLKLSNLSKKKERIVIQRDGSEKLTSEQIDAIFKQRNKRNNYNSGFPELPTEILIVGAGQTFESIMQDEKDMLKNEINNNH